MIAYIVVWPWYWLEGSHNGPRPKAEVIMGARRSIPWPCHSKHPLTYYTCGLDHKYRVLVSVCLSVCLCVSTRPQKIYDLGS